MTVRMLIEGHSDPASAKRLGVSTRTYAGYIAALKDEYGVETRFQLGLRDGEQGLGVSTPRADRLDDRTMVHEGRAPDGHSPADPGGRPGTSHGGQPGPSQVWGSAGALTRGGRRRLTVASVPAQPSR